MRSSLRWIGPYSPFWGRATARTLEEIIALMVLTLLMVCGPIGLWLVVHWFVTRRFSVPDLGAAMERLENSFQFPAITPGSVLVVRARGDEASAALATSHFLSLPLTALSRSLGLFVNFGVWLAELTVGWSAWKQYGYGVLSMCVGFAALLGPHFRIFLILGSGLMLLGVIFVIPFGVEVMGLFFIAITGVPFLILVTLITIVSSPFGLDTALLAPRFEMTAETTPPGQVTVFELSSESATGLWHSTPYGNDEAFNEIASWLRALRSDRTVG
jgi:hypothetical protein